MSDEDWNAFWGQLTGQLGQTWADLLEEWGKDAVALSQSAGDVEAADFSGGITTLEATLQDIDEATQALGWNEALGSAPQGQGASFQTSIQAAGDSVGRTYGLVLSAQNYKQNTTEMNLWSTKWNFYQMRDVLMNQAQVPEGNMELVQDRTGKEITNSYMKSALDRLAANKKQEDTLFFYFTGHGFEKQMFLPDGSGFYYSELYNKLNKSKAGKIVVVIDACHSGSFTDWLKQQKGDSNVSRWNVVTATEANNTGQGNSIGTRGNFFTYRLTDALSRGLSLYDAWNKNKSFWEWPFMGLPHRQQPGWFDGGTRFDLKDGLGKIKDPANGDDGLGNTPPGSTRHQMYVGRAGSVDPNEKQTTGLGAAGYMIPGIPITYTIYFENDPAHGATAPVQELLVTDTLSVNLDWSTFELMAIGFWQERVTIPPGQNVFSTTATLENDPYPVNIEAGLDPNTGTVTWKIWSIDPVTGSFPADPFSGFLPVNDATGRGEGFVTFKITPRTNLAEGLQIRNQATITFDPTDGLNPPIVTNETLNTVDSGAPTSQVGALPAVQTSASFAVSWSGSDDGSGIASYDVYVKQDEGAWTQWLDDTATMSGTYVGQEGHTYQFYSVSKDAVGHEESAPGTADATTYTDERPAIGGLTVNPDPVHKERQVTLTATNVADGDGTVTAVEFYRDVNGNGILEPGADALLGTDNDGTGGWSWQGVVNWSEGEHTIFARARDNNGAWSITAENATAVVEPGIEVTIGDGANKALTYTDLDGTVVTVTIKGGQATVRLRGENLQQSAGKKGVTVTGIDVEIAEIILANTTAKSSLTLATRGGNGLAAVGRITGGAPVGKLAGKGIDLVGEGIAMTGEGSIASVTLHDVLNGADLLMPGAGNVAGTTLAVGRIGAGTKIELGSGVKSLTAAEWQDGQDEALQAPWASKISIAGDFGADLDLNGAGNPKQTLGSLTIKGNAQDADWDIQGVTGKVNIIGEMEEIDFSTTGVVTSLTAGGMRRSKLLGGVKENVEGLPDGLDDFEALVEIKSVTVKGPYIDSILAASSLGKVSLKDVQSNNDTKKLGIAADKIKSYIRGVKKLSNLDAPGVVDEEGDYIVRIV